MTFMLKFCPQLLPLLSVAKRFLAVAPVLSLGWRRYLPSGVSSTSKQGMEESPLAGLSRRPSFSALERVLLLF